MFRFEQEGIAAGSFDGMALPLPPTELTFRLTNQSGASGLFSNLGMGASVQLQSLGTPGAGVMGLGGFFQQAGSMAAFSWTSGGASCRVPSRRPRGR
jgi:hypothetical protein